MIYFFLFYDKSQGPQAKLAFSKVFRHCDIIVFDGESYVYLNFGPDGILPRVIPTRNCLYLAGKLCTMPELVAQIVVRVENKKRIKWKPFWVRSCNEFCRHVSCIDIPFTWTPKDLHCRLLEYNHMTNFKIIYEWTREKTQDHTEVKHGRNYQRIFRRFWERCTRRSRRTDKTNTRRDTTED